MFVELPSMLQFAAERKVRAHMVKHIEELRAHNDSLRNALSTLRHSLNQSEARVASLSSSVTNSLQVTPVPSPRRPDESEPALCPPSPLRSAEAARSRAVHPSLTPFYYLWSSAL